MSNKPFILFQKMQTDHVNVDVTSDVIANTTTLLDNGEL